MKRLFLFVLSLAIVGVSNAQKTKPTTTKTTTVKPVTSKPVAMKPSTGGMKTLDDSASYAIGLSVVNFYKQQGVNNLNSVLVSKAINDIMGGKPAAIDDATATSIMNRYMSKLQEDKSKPTIEAGEKFLAQNKLRPGVKTTPSGLQYEVITEGTGPAPTGVTDSVTCNYKGTFIDGTEFDNSYKRGEPITFALNKVIAGWTEGLQLMKTGSKYKLYVPYTLGYGIFDYNGIPGGSALVFEVELLGVKKM